VAFLSAPAPMELILILGIALLVLGPSRLPDAARSLGRGLRELREALQNGSEDEDDDPYKPERDDLPERS
jgi:sec-independent protein translocase protein TatA